MEPNCTRSNKIQIVARITNTVPTRVSYCPMLSGGWRLPPSDQVGEGGGQRDLHLPGQHGAAHQPGHNIFRYIVDI